MRRKSIRVDKISVRGGMDGSDFSAVLSVKALGTITMSVRQSAEL